MVNIMLLISRGGLTKKFLIDNRTSERTCSEYIHIDERDFWVTMLIDGSDSETTTAGTNRGIKSNMGWAPLWYVFL